MTQHTPPGHRAVVEAALNDWWITADFAEPFAPDSVAEHVEMHLTSSGYRIAPDTIPSRASITVSALLTLLITASGTATALRGEWWWTLAAVALAAFLTREIHHDLTERRRIQSRRPR